MMDSKINPAPIRPLDPGTHLGAQCPFCKGIYCTDRCLACASLPTPSGALTDHELDAVLETWVHAPFPSGAKTLVEEKNAGLLQLARMATEAQLRKNAVALTKQGATVDAEGIEMQASPHCPHPSWAQCETALSMNDAKGKCRKCEREVVLKRSHLEECWQWIQSSILARDPCNTDVWINREEAIAAAQLDLADHVADRDKQIVKLNQLVNAAKEESAAWDLVRRWIDQRKPRAFARYADEALRMLTSMQHELNRLRCWRPQLTDKDAIEELRLAWRNEADPTAGEITNQWARTWAKAKELLGR
jgi:hypothetical protein